MITEDNILHQPSSVRRIPANVVIVMDTGGEMRQIKSLDQTRKTAKAVVGALRDGDSMAADQLQRQGRDRRRMDHGQGADPRYDR